MTRVRNGIPGAPSAATLRWHLTLLGISGIALSIASGWTTWDGMANFTQNPVLSFLITFGIQSVMLVAAWMIGETFAEQAKKPGAGNPAAIGRSGPAGSINPGRHPFGGFETRVTLIWMAIFALSVALMSNAVSNHITGLSLGYGPAIAALVSGAMLLRAALRMFGLGEIISPYERSTAAILKNVPLWIMFLVCLTASVFFSFDSLFDRIYSEDDREAVSRSRLQSHVSGLLPDLQAELEKSRRTAAAGLFDGPQWQAFDNHVDRLTRAVDDVRARIESRRADEANDKQLKIAKDVALLSSAGAEMDSVDDQLERAKADLEKIDQDLAKARADERDLDLALTRQRVQMDQTAQEAVLEAAGQGLSQRTGKGPQYRELKGREVALRTAVNQSAGQLAAGQRLTARLREERIRTTGHIDKIRLARAEIAGRIAQAEWRVDDTRGNSPARVDNLQKFTAEVMALNAARTGFLDQPDKRTYRALNSRCGNVAAIPPSVIRADPAVRSFKCGTFAGNSALVGIFDANAALARFQQACGKTRKLTGLNADELFQTGQSCIQMAGLSSAIAADFLSSLRQVSLRRDDRAHRFVVTWNAFFDTNPLAFVALFIALSIDGLVFVSGLFGANAQITLRMLAHDRPSSSKLKSDISHEAILDFALLPDAAGTARLLLGALKPAPGTQPDGVAGELDLSELSADDAERIRPVLNAACALKMSENVNGGNRFTVRTDLISHLSPRTGWQRGVLAGTWVRSDPEQLLTLALGRDRGQITQCVLEQSHPMPDDAGYAYVMDVRTCPEHIQPQMTAVLNAGVAGGTVSGDPGEDQRYLLTAAFVSMIARLTAEEPEPVSNPMPSETVAATPEQAADMAGVDRKPATHGNPAPDDRVDILAAAPDLAEGKGRSLSTSRPSPPVIIPKDEPANDHAASSTLIAFPAESKLRRTASAGPDRYSPKTDPDKTTVTPMGSGRGARSEIIEEAIAGLIAGSKIARQDVVDWLCAKPGPQFDAAWSVLEELRDGDRDFRARLRKHDRSTSNKIDLFQNALPADYLSSGSFSSGGAIDGKPDLPGQVYRPFLLHNYALNEAMAWCTEAISKLEVNAVLDSVSEARHSELMLIGKIIAALSPLDRHHGEEWRELELRVGGLSRQRSEFESFNDLMP